MKPKSNDERRAELVLLLERLHNNGKITAKDYADLKFGVLCWQNSELAIDALLKRTK